MSASVWLGYRMFGLRAYVSTFSVMVDQGATVGQWLSWLLSDAAPALMAGLFVISAVSALVGSVLATLIWENWIRLHWWRKLNRSRDQRLERSTLCNKSDEHSSAPKTLQRISTVDLRVKT